MKLVVNGVPATLPEAHDDLDPLDAFASEAAPPLAKSSNGNAPIARDRARAVLLTRRALIAVLSLLLLSAAGVASLRELRARWLAGSATGRVTIAANPAGADVVIDGTRRGVTPLTLDLPRGRYKVTLHKGGASRDLSIEVRPGVELVQNVELAATTGALSVTSDPPGLRLAIDGADHGMTPGTLERLTPGAHKISLTGQKGSTERSVLIRAGATSTLHVALTPSAREAPAAGVGSVTITAPIDLQLFQGETLVGSSRSARLFLPSGRHTITAVNEGLGFRRAITLEIRPGAATRVAVPVPNGALSVNARPWAEVFVDGKSLGETPIGNYALPIGSHELQLKHPQLGERRQNVVIAVGRTARVGMDLRQ